MAKTSIDQFDTTAANNTDVNAVSCAVGWPAINIGNVVRNLMKLLKQYLANSVSVASASTVDLGAQTGNYITITGTTTITAFGTVAAGTWKQLKFSGALTLTYNATSLILPGAANITTAAGDTAEFVSEGSGNWRCLNYQRADGTPVFATGRLLNVFYYTSNATYSKNALASYVIAECTGSGGGGGGCPLTGAGQSSAGAGGGGGGYALAKIANASLSATTTVTVGAAGTGGTAGQNNGGNGNSSSFGAFCVATGGNGGVSAAATATVGVISGGNSAGTGTSGDLLLAGSSGGPSFGFAGQNTPGGTGGGSPLYGPGVASAINAAGATGPGYGSGGGGASNPASQSAKAGGNGAGGLVIVREYA